MNLGALGLTGKHERHWHTCCFEFPLAAFAVLNCSLKSLSVFILNKFVMLGLGDSLVLELISLYTKQGRLNGIWGSRTLDQEYRQCNYIL